MAILQNLYSKFISSWRQASRTKRMVLYVGIYTVVFLATFLIAYSPFLLEGKSFIWQGDGRWQHFPFLVYVGRLLRRIVLDWRKGIFSLPLFDINIALGDDIIGFLGSAGFTDPLVLLSAFVPMKWTEHLYAFLAIFRLYIAGLSFSFLCFYFRKRTLYTLIGSMVHCFAGYAILCSMRHPYFINPMILLPLLVVGCDEIMKKKQPYLFIVAVFYSALCGYYHLYMMTIMIFFYAAARFFDLYVINRTKEFLRALGRGG